MQFLSDRYEIIQPIGRGGVGVVYEGRQVALDRPVAIKVLRPEMTRNAAAVARFEREARTTCRLHHPNVVTVFDVGISDDGHRFLIMELLKGKTLSQRLREDPPLSYPEKLAIAHQIVRGMGAGQGVGLVHRDLKPENIFIVDDTHVKILDFGLATLLAQEDRLSEADGAPLEVEAVLEGDTLMLSSGSAPTQDPSMTFDLAGTGFTPSLDPADTPLESGRLTNLGAPMGTPRYMAPEQVLGWDIDHRSDLYSFGCILYEMLTSRSPFEGPGSKDFMRQHLHHPPASLDDLGAEVPDAMRSIVERLLRKRPSDRFSDWAALAESLRRLDTFTATRRNTTEAQPVLLDPPPEPFRFLHPFTASFQCVFFGRDEDIIRFQSAWRHPDQPPIILLTGASGVGKTSFLAARVIPALEDLDLHVMRVRGGAQPLQQLHQVVLRLLARTEKTDVDTPLPQLMDQLIAQSGQPVAVVLDQLEEVFTSTSVENAAELQAGIAAILSGGDPRIRLILSIREDFLGPLYRALYPLPVDEITRTVPLMPLRESDLVAALEGPGKPGLPVDYAPFSFEDGLVDEIVSDLQADSAGEVAPRVQAVGARLWEMVRDDPAPVIRGHHYRESLGGARGILARILDEAITDLSASDRGVAKEMLRALTHLPGSATSRPTPESELLTYAEDLDRRREVLRRLENRWRVVQGYTDPRHPDERSYRIAHEALINQIREYGSEGTEQNRARQLFHQGFHLWLKGGRRVEDLLPEQHFDEIQRYIEDLVLRTADERLFYQRCLETHNEGWMRRHLEKRRHTIIRRIQWTILPTLIFLLGVILGQFPVDFISLRTLRVKTLSGLTVPRMDLTGERIPRSDLSGLSLSQADFTDADLEGAILKDADLRMAIMVRTNLDRANLSGANLQGAKLEDAHMTQTVLVGADLRSAIIRSRITHADFSAARFDRRTLWPESGPPQGALGPGGHADELVAPDSDLKRMNLTHLDAPMANLAGSNFANALLTWANLRKANLSGSNLSDTQMSEANLEGALLTHASLQDAELINTTLKGADLRWTNIRGTNFRGVKDLETIRWDDAIADSDTKWPKMAHDKTSRALHLLPGAILGPVNLSERNLADISVPRISLRGADLTGANLKRANLMGADLTDADLRRADLRGADLRGAQMGGVQLCGANLEDANIETASLTGATTCTSTRFTGGIVPLGLR